jgi:hypothetical protein
MKLQTFIETNPRDLADIVCEDMNMDELFQLIREIETNVCQYEFTEKLMNYCKGIIDAENSLGDK